MILDPALRTLLRLKLKGALRRQWRRVRTPKGALFSLLGVTVLSVWMVGILASTFFRSGADPDPLAAGSRIRLGGLLLFTMALASALNHRGLSVPKEEIERLFAAPLRRAQIVRYRLAASVGRSLFGGVVLGAVAGLRMPAPLLGFLGVMVSMQALPVASQMLAIALGAFERRFTQGLQWAGRGLFLATALLFGGVVYLLLSDRQLEDLPFLVELGRGVGAEILVEDPFSHPLFLALTTPFVPWVHLITAPDPLSFLPWLGVCVTLWFLMVEVTARLPVDYRELSLETAASVAARLRRARAGGGAAASAVSGRAAGWRIPWLFGRGPAGAVAWRKTGSILRKAKGALGVSAVILLFLTLLSTTVMKGDEQALAAPFLIGILGTLYLCAGLRFDFRDELERMEVVRAWPVRPTRLFAAMLLPEALLVTVILEAAVVLRVVVGGVFEPLFLGLVLTLPLLIFAWIALDNAVFLYLPVRVLPGQEGALQNAGRGVVMMLTRFTMMGILGGVGLGLGGGGWLLGQELFGWSAGPSGLLGFALVFGGLLAVDVLVVWLGGKALRQFDVARDRG